MCQKKFNVTYKEIPDESFNEVVNYIEYLKKNPKLNLLFWKVIF